MKKQLITFGVACLLTLPVSALAAKNTKPVAMWNCEDFLSLDESYRPTAIGFAEALNKKGQTEDSVLDVDGLEKITPILIETCKKYPQSKFLTELETAWKDIKKDM